jgi:hypothetical protein
LIAGLVFELLLQFFKTLNGVVDGALNIGDVLSPLMRQSLLALTERGDSFGLNSALSRQSVFRRLQSFQARADIVDASWFGLLRYRPAAVAAPPRSARCRRIRRTRRTVAGRRLKAI